MMVISEISWFYTFFNFFYKNYCILNRNLLLYKYILWNKTFEEWEHTMRKAPTTVDARPTLDHAGSQSRNGIF